MSIVAHSEGNDSKHASVKIEFKDLIEELEEDLGSGWSFALTAVDPRGLRTYVFKLGSNPEELQLSLATIEDHITEHLNPEDEEL